MGLLSDLKAPSGFLRISILSTGNKRLWYNNDISFFPFKVESYTADFPFEDAQKFTGTARQIYCQN